MAIRKVKTSTKAKKKKWYPIYAPKLFNDAFIGETYKADADSIVGKTVTVNLMSLTGDVKKQNINVTFIVTDVKDDKVKTSVLAYKLMHASIKRFVRRRKDKIDDSLLYTLGDGKKVRVKTLILTRGNTNNSVSSSIRRNVRALLTRHLSKMTFDALFMDVVYNKLQRHIKQTLSKIYPIGISEIRSMHLEKVKTLGAVTPSEIKKQETRVPKVPKEEEKPEKTIEEPAENKKETVEQENKEETTEQPAEEKSAKNDEDIKEEMPEKTEPKEEVKEEK